MAAGPKGTGIPILSIGVKAIKGVIGAVGGVQDALGKSKSLKLQLHRTQCQLDVAVEFIKEMNSSNCAAPEKLNMWAVECFARAQTLIASSKSILGMAEADVKGKLLMNARGVIEGLAESVADTVDMESFDPRTIMLSKLADVEELLTVVVQHAQNCVSLFLLKQEVSINFIGALNKSFPARIWLLPLAIEAVEPGSELVISWRHVGLIERVQIHISHDVAGEHHVTGDFWKRVLITPDGGIENGGIFRWQVETEKQGDHWIYISAYESEDGDPIDCPTDSLDIKVEKAVVKSFETPSPSKSLFGSTTWSVGQTEEIELEVGLLVTQLCVLAIWHNKGTGESETTLLVNPAAACSQGKCKFGWKVPLEMYAASGNGHWILRAYVPDPDMESQSGIPPMSPEQGCVESTEIKLKLKCGQVGSVVLSNTKGLARRRAQWLVGTTQSIKWKSEGFECDQSRIVMELCDPTPEDVLKKVEIVGDFPNQPGANEYDYVVAPAPDPTWVGRDVRIKVLPSPDMRELLHEVSPNLTGLDASREMSWPDATDVVKMSGATSVIINITEEEEGEDVLDDAPPEYEEVVALKLQMEEDFKPMEGDVAVDLWCGELTDMFPRLQPDQSPHRYVDLIDGQLCISGGDNDQGWGKRFKPETSVNSTLAPTDNPSQRKTNLCSQMPENASDELKAEVNAGALTFTATIGTALGKRVIKWNSCYDGAGGSLAGTQVAASESDNFWEYMDPSEGRSSDYEI